jgi:predicted nucleotidyltransferase
MRRSRNPILDKLNSEIETMGERFGVRRIGLFGSHVRGEADRTSDIDVLVEFEEPTFDRYMDLKVFLEELFGVEVDVVLADSVKPRLKPYILDEVVYAEGL